MSRKGSGLSPSDPERAGDSAGAFRVAADAYQRYVGRYAHSLAEALIDVADVRPGQRALDVGCGPGALAAVLADRLGAGNVSAVDPSEPFVEACRARVPGADVRLGFAERLPFGQEFDAVLSQLVVNFMADAPAGVGEMRRVTRPGGIVASAVWDYADGMTLLRTFWDAAVAVDPGAVALDEGRAMRYCREAELGELWESAGLGGVATGELAVEARYESFTDLAEPLSAGVGPSGAYFVSLDARQRELLLSGWHARLGSPDGPFQLSARAWYAAGRA